MDQSPLLEGVQRWWSAQHEHPVPAGPDSPWDVVRFQHEMPCGFGCEWRKGRTNDQLIASLRPYVRAKTVEAANALQQPSVRLALTLANQLMPRPYGTDLTVLADVIEAAGAQTVEARNRAIGRALASVGVSMGLGLVIAFVKATPEQRLAWW
jgi:hypothetical protein